MNNEQGLQLQRLTGHVLDDAEGGRQAFSEPCVAYVLNGAFCRAIRSGKLKQLPMFIPREQRRLDPPKSHQIGQDGGQR